jgi:flagellin
MYSIQTNVTSLMAQQNLLVNGDFQDRTIQRLTSGFRINSSGDDAAGLAVANQFRSYIAELNQGVRNANDGISTLQIIDGGLNNISKILDRLKTLATQSASDTFTGDRATLDAEFGALLTEIDRQAANIGLDSGGTYATTIAVYIGGGGATQANSQVSIDLTTAEVDSVALAIDGEAVDDTTNALAAITALDAAVTAL